MSLPSGSDSQDPLRAYLDLLVESIDAPASGEELARRAHLSRFHFDHVVRAATGEPPGRLRRRILMERAAWELKTSAVPVTAIALAAGYEAVGSFTRAFHRDFSTSPAGFRARPGPHVLSAPNGIHYHPPAGLSLPGPETGGGGLLGRLLEHDHWLTRRALEAARALADEHLDAPAGGMSRPWFGGETLRGLLERMVSSREMWTATMTGEQCVSRSGSVEALVVRWETVGQRFRALCADLEADGGWDRVFIDATRDPPERFTFGGAVAHLLTFAALRRSAALELLQRHGAATELGCGDPVEWERLLSAGSV